MHPLAEYVMRGRWHAAGVVGSFAAAAWFCAVLSPAQPLLLIFALAMAVLSAATLSLTVLRRGPRDGFVVLAYATLILLMLVTLLKIGPDTAAVTMPIWVLICAASLVLRLTASQGAMLVSVATLVGILLAAMYFAVGDLADWVERKVAESPEVLDAMLRSGLTEDQVRNQVRMMPLAMSAMGACGVIVTTLLGRWWQALVYNPGEFRTEFQALRLPRTLLLVFGALMLVLGMAGEAAPNILTLMLAIITALYVFQGLAVVHFRTARGGLSDFWLVGLYMFFFLATLVTVPLMVVTGITDAIFDLRRQPKT